MERKRYSKILILLAFCAIYFVWGTTYLANLFALKGFPPFILAVFRYLSAGILLALYAVFSGLRWPDASDFKTLAISGIMMLVGGSGLVAYAQLYIGSGYAAAIIATEPLWFVLLDRKRFKMYFSRIWILIGLVVGFAGIAWYSFFSPESANATGSSHWSGTILLMLGSVFWVLGALYADRHLKADSPNVTGTAIQLFAASGISVVIAFFRDEWTDFTWTGISTEGWAGFGYLVVMGSVVAFLAFNLLIKAQPPAIVSTHTYVNPVVAIFMGWLIVGEKISLTQGLGLAGVFVGVLLIQLNKPKETP